MYYKEFEIGTSGSRNPAKWDYFFLFKKKVLTSRIQLNARPITRLMNPIEILTRVILVTLGS